MVHMVSQKSLYWFPTAAVTNYRELSDLKQYKFIILQFLRSEVQHKFHFAKIRGWQDCIPSGGSRTIPFSHFLQLPVAVCIPWLLTRCSYHYDIVLPFLCFCCHFTFSMTLLSSSYKDHCNSIGLT